MIFLPEEYSSILKDSVIKAKLLPKQTLMPLLLALKSLLLMPLLCRLLCTQVPEITYVSGLSSRA